MPTSTISEVRQHLRSVWLPGSVDLTDGQLLECFLRGREPAALEALVRRHAPMLWGVCRRVLQNHHDAEDALQATFLVLVRKAAVIRAPALLGNWLYGVAYQTALKARATRARRTRRERQVANMPEPAVTDPELWNDLQLLLDQEVSRLPEKYRIVIVFCELEGKTVSEAARQLDLPQGTVASRLSRARALLTRRLGRQGLAVSGGVLTAVLSQNLASASVPTSVLSATIKAVTAVAAGQAAAGVVSLNVAALTEGVLKAMLMTKLNRAMMVLLAAAAVVGFGGVLYRTQAADAGQPSPELPRIAAEQNPPVEGKSVQDKDQESKKPTDKPKGATGTAKGEADEKDKPAKPTEDRVKQVRQMYAKLPSDILGVKEPMKRIVAMTKRATGHLTIIFEDANAKEFTIYLFPGAMDSPLMLSAGRLPLRGPEESAVYGLLLRLAANPPEKTMPGLLKAVDSILTVLDERFAGATPITSNGAKK